MDQETRNEMDEIKAAQLRTNQSMEELTSITAGLATTVNGLATTVDGFIKEQRQANIEQREINKSLKAGQDQLSAIANKLLDDKD